MLSSNFSLPRPLLPSISYPTAINSFERPRTLPLPHPRMKLADLLNDKSNSSKDASPEKSPLTSYNISNTKPSEAYPRTTKDHSSSLEELSRASKALISPTLDSKSSRTLAQPSFLGSRSLQDLSQYNDRARNSHIRSHGPMGTRSVSFSGTDSIPNYDHETKNHMARSTYNKQYDQFTPNYNTHSDYSIATLPPCDRTHQSYTSYHNRINNAGGSSPSMNRFPPLLTLRSRNHSLETTATSVSVNSADLPLTPMLTSSYASQKYSNHHDDKNSVHIEVIEAPPIRKKQPKRSKASNTTWTSEDDSQLIDMVLSTLPRQNYASYATRLSKRDSQSVRYRWKRLIKKFKGDLEINLQDTLEESSESSEHDHEDEDDAPPAKRLKKVLVQADETKDKNES